LEHRFQGFGPVRIRKDRRLHTERIELLQILGNLRLSVSKIACRTWTLIKPITISCRDVVERLFTAPDGPLELNGSALSTTTGKPGRVMMREANLSF
jgi:hypothetical protein